MKHGDKIYGTSYAIWRRSNKNFKYSYRYRQDPVPNCGGCRSWCCGSPPRVNGQIRENIRMKEEGFRVRGKRTRWNLPDSWDYKGHCGRQLQGKRTWKRSKIKRQYLKRFIYKKDDGVMKAKKVAELLLKYPEFEVEVNGLYPDGSDYGIALIQGKVIGIADIGHSEKVLILNVEEKI